MGTRIHGGVIKRQKLRASTTAETQSNSWPDRQQWKTFLAALMASGNDGLLLEINGGLF